MPRETRLWEAPWVLFIGGNKQGVTVHCILW